MKRAPLILLLIILLSPSCLAQSSIEAVEGEELYITIHSSSSPYQMEIFLCQEECLPLEVRSVSYNDNQIDIFALPENPGVYELKVFLGDEVYEKEVTIKKGHEKAKNEKISGVTSNIVGNASSPLFIAGLAGFLLLFIFLKLEIRLKTKPLMLFKGQAKFLLVFVFSFLILSPFMHEFFHILTAGIFNCQAVLESFIPVLTPTTVTFDCEISALHGVLILAAGVAGNLVLGLAFLALSRINRTFSPVSLAFLWSSFFYLFYTTGDLHSIMEILGFTVPQVYLDLSGVILISFSSFIFLKGSEKFRTSARIRDTTGICRPAV